jgi:hypothetical protein
VWCVVRVVPSVTGLNRKAGEMKKAKYIVTLDGFRGNAALYELGRNRFVVVSAICNEFGTETYIFESNCSGVVADWSELQGSYKGGMDHATALRGLGYEL